MVVCWDIFSFSTLFYVQTGKVESGEGGGCVPSLLESVLRFGTWAEGRARVTWMLAVFSFSYKQKKRNCEFFITWLKINKGCQS